MEKGFERSSNHTRSFTTCKENMVGSKGLPELASDGVVDHSSGVVPPEQDVCLKWGLRHKRCNCNVFAETPQHFCITATRLATMIWLWKLVHCSIWHHLVQGCTSLLSVPYAGQLI